MNQQNSSRKAPHTKRNHLDGWTKVWKSANLLIGCICLSGSIAHAQKNPVSMQPAQQPTTVTPSSQPQLGATHAALCMLADCNKPPKPVINGVDPSSAITPGGQVVVMGTNFNSNDHKNGDIILTIGTKSAMTRRMIGQQFYTQPYREAHLTVLGWSDGHAYGQIPGDISGVMDGPADIQIRRSDGTLSNTMQVQFTAARVVATLFPAADMHTDSCSNNGDENQCDSWADFSGPFSTNGLSIIGTHVKFLKNTGTPESAIDSYTFSLNNGWAWDATKDTNNLAYKSCGADSIDKIEISDYSSSGGTVKFSWTAACQVTYQLWVYITGPKGVPWK